MFGAGVRLRCLPVGTSVAARSDQRDHDLCGILADGHWRYEMFSSFRFGNWSGWVQATRSEE